MTLQINTFFMTGEKTLDFFLIIWIQHENFFNLVFYKPCDCIPNGGKLVKQTETVVCFYTWGTIMIERITNQNCILELVLDSGLLNSGYFWCWHFIYFTFELVQNLVIMFIFYNITFLSWQKNKRNSRFSWWNEENI